MRHATRLLLVPLACAACGDGPTPVGGDGPPVVPGSSDRIARENQLPGDGGWELDQPALDREIEGYADVVSTAAGEPVRIAVATSTPARYGYRVYRLGHYGGAGGRLLVEGGPLDGQPPPPPSFDPATGLVEAGWAPAFTIATRDDDGTPWPTGVYLVKLERADGPQSYSVFVLRDDARDAELAFELPTATWQAYNRWGGESLYDSEHGLPGGKAVKVSYDRPYAAELGFGSGLFLSMDWPAARWLEAHGYDVEYTTNLDTGGRGGRVGAHRAFVSVGHDEYLTVEAMDRLAAAVERGTSLLFLSGNTAYWAVRTEDSPAGAERVVVCYKDRPRDDPMFTTDPGHVTTRFRDPPLSRPENGLLGVQSDGDAVDSPVPWVVTNAGDWPYAGTGLADGDAIPDLVGFEWDGVAANGHAPAGLRVLADSPVLPGSRHNATIYERGDAFVFSAGTIYFGRGLRDDPRVERMLQNLLDRAGVRPQAP